MDTRAIMGGKGKGLEKLKKYQSLGYKVPDFDFIDVSYYEYINKQNLIAQLASILSSKPYEPNRLLSQISNKLDDILQNFKGKDVIIRSSSLNEDSEHSFAGIYESIIVNESTKDKLCDAVRKVYDSMNSDKAQRYRKEHGIKDDSMAIIIQNFVEPDFSGVMYTSNPSYPDDLSIEFCKRRIDESYEKYIVDFDKKNRKNVFQSENFPRDDSFDIIKLFELGKKLEKRFGPSDIEFVIKNKDIYIVQCRKITDLAEPEEIDMPDYDKNQFIGKTNVKRGKGKITLPIVKVSDFSEFIGNISLLVSTHPDESKNQIKGYFDNIIRLNKQYKDGYIFVTPHFYETAIKACGVFLDNINYNTDMDSLTPNKKAVITTKFNSISSHIMTVARERGISYAGFRDEEFFKNIHTSDVLSIYFKGREAYVYKEKTKPKSLKELFPEISVKISDRNKIGHYFEVDNSIDTSIVICKDFEYFLSKYSDKKWSFEDFGGVMGGIFTDETGRSLQLCISKDGKSYYWSLYPTHKSQAKKPMKEKELKPLIQKYVEYLRS